MDAHAEDLLNAALATAKRLGVPASVTEVAEDRAVILIGKGPRAKRYAAAIKRGLRPATLGAALHPNELDGEPRLLIADYVTPPMAETLKARGTPFLDAAGNAFLDQPPIYVWIKGERPKEKAATGRTSGRAFQTAGLKVLFVFLSHPNWVARSYREIARAARVAHGTVGWVMAELQELGFIAMVSGTRRLLQREQLLQQWAEAYARTMRARLVIRRYRTDVAGWWKKLDPRKYDAQFGGEAAAERITRSLRPEAITLYTTKADAALLLEFKLRQDPIGPVELVERFWDFDIGDSLTVPLPLVFADLLMTGDARCVEAAELVYERIVDSFR